MCLSLVQYILRKDLLEFTFADWGPGNQVSRTVIEAITRRITARSEDTIVFLRYKRKSTLRLRWLPLARLDQQSQVNLSPGLELLGGREAGLMPRHPTLTTFF